ncbi:MAG: Gfo/Idh/MocA family oxidoreductase [Pseudomonadota bacterium]|nr:Gfo/Idh/MocA family oxidoreductase [Pseudomonadota bacterium]
MSDRLRVGVIGVGYLGKFHAGIYAAMPDVELVGVADVDAAAAAAVAAKQGCRVYTRAEDLLGKVDAVSIVVPTVHHLPVARPFLESGVHMLMEKPLAPDYEEALALVELAERSGAIFQVGHLERFNAGVMALVERVREPRFIEVHRLGGFVERATDVDVVTDLMIHDIDIVMSLVGSPIRDIAATGLPVLTEHVDIANARIEFANGAVANVTASRVSNKKQRRIRVFGRNGYHALNYIDQQIEVARAVSSPGGGRAEIVAEQVAVEPRQPLDAELAEFIRSIRTGQQPLVGGRTGLEALRVALMVKEKIASCLRT